MFIAFGLLVLILAVVAWVFLTSVFGIKIYNGAEKIYKNLTKEETKGEKDL
jgi:hypothetical protein